jgi:hypothetical protein
MKAISDQAANKIAFLYVAFLGALGFSLLVPFFWHDKLYVDGAKIVSTTPSISPSADSWSVAAGLLWPILKLLAVLGFDVQGYGTSVNSDLFIINAVFGAAAFVCLTVVVRWSEISIQVDRRVAEAGVVIVLSGPFMFAVSKELIPLGVSTIVLAVAHTRRWSASRTGVVFAISLALMSIYLRAYYVAIALVLFVLQRWCRTPQRVAAGVVGVFVLLLLLYPVLPLQEIERGRASYLADISASRIQYHWSDASAIGFVLNRVTTFAGMAAPVGLILRSPAYAPFVVMQVLITVRVLQVIKNDGSGFRLLAAHVILAFTLISSIFEPDYGSYFRHKTGSLLFMAILLFDVVPRLARADVRRRGRSRAFGRGS